MKSLFLLIFIVLSANATEISNLMYFNKAGTFVSDSHLLIQKKWYERVNNTTKLKENDIEDKLSLINEEFTYGVLDNLLIGVNFAYNISNKEITNFTNSTTSVTKNSTGLNNMGFLVKYRLFDEKDKPVSLDFKLFLSPAIQRKFIATTSVDGNGSRGAFLSKLDISVGSKLEKFSWRALMSLTKTMDGTGDDVVTNLTSIDYKGTLDILVEARAQMILTDQFSLEGGVGFEKFGAREETTKLTPIIKTTYDSYSDFNFFSKLNYEISPKRFLTSIELAYSLSTENNISSNTTVYNRRKPGKFSFILAGSIFF